MAGLPWIPLSVDFPDSAKAVALGVAVQDPLAWAYVVRLWTWCAKNAMDGRIEGPSAIAVVEHAAGWKSAPGALVEAMSLPHVRLLDVTESGFAVHDWADHCGAHVEKREKDRARMKRSRRSNRSRTVREPSAHVQGEREREREKDPIVQVGERDSIPGNANAPALNREQIERDTARRLGAEDRSGLTAHEEAKGQKYPRAAALLAALAATGAAGAWPRAQDTCAAVEASIGEQPLDAVALRVAASIRAAGKPWLGHHIDAIRGTSPPGSRTSRGMVPPSTDWPTETREVKL